MVYPEQLQSSWVGQEGAFYRAQTPHRLLRLRGSEPSSGGQESSGVNCWHWPGCCRGLRQMIPAPRFSVSSWWITETAPRKWGSRASVCVLVTQSCPTPRTVTHRAPLSEESSRQGYWSELLFPSPGDLPNPGIEPGSPALQADSLLSELPGKPSRMAGKSPQDKSNGSHRPPPGQVAQPLWCCCSCGTYSEPGWAAVSLRPCLWLHLGPSITPHCGFPL